MQVCPICGKETKKLKIHHWKAHGAGVTHNPKLGLPPWNKGLTKETDERVRMNGEAVSRATRGRPGIIHTEETKRKISAIRKQYLDDNPDKVPYVLNHSSKISYPEQYFLECFSDITNLAFQYPVKRFILDFANVDEKLYLEIDGEQHYSDKRIVEHDVVRTAILADLGWIGIRVRWSRFVRLSDGEKVQELHRIRAAMKWLT